MKERLIIKPQTENIRCSNCRDCTCRATGFATTCYNHIRLTVNYYRAIWEMKWLLRVIQFYCYMIALVTSSWPFQANRGVRRGRPVHGAGGGASAPAVPSRQTFSLCHNWLRCGSLNVLIVLMTLFLLHSRHCLSVLKKKITNQTFKAKNNLTKSG